MKIKARSVKQYNKRFKFGDGNRGLNVIIKLQNAMI